MNIFRTLIKLIEMSLVLIIKAESPLNESIPVLQGKLLNWSPKRIKAARFVPQAL